jgi:hypothetical protein
VRIRCTITPISLLSTAVLWSGTTPLEPLLAVIKCIYLPSTYLHFIQDIEDWCLLLMSSMTRGDDVAQSPGPTKPKWGRPVPPPWPAGQVLAPFQSLLCQHVKVGWCTGYPMPKVSAAMKLGHPTTQSTDLASPINTPVLLPAESVKNVRFSFL